MSKLDLIPDHLRKLSISQREVVLPLAAALEAIDYFEAQDIRILGWEGWVKDETGRVGHGSAPQGWTADSSKLTVQEAAQLCRATIPNDARKWELDHPGSTDKLHFCITVRA